MKKKVFALMMTMAMASVFSSSVCYAKDGKTEAYESLEEINEISGVNLVTPENLEITDQSYCIIDDQIAEYKFTADGIEYTFRGLSCSEEDITDVFTDKEKLLDSMDDSGYAADENGKIMAWTISGDEMESEEYVLYTEDYGELDEETFRDLQSELMNGTLGVVSDEDFGKELYAALEGSYTDETSERASLDIENNGDHITMLVHWGSSVEEYTQWKMTAVFDAEYGLRYEDCVKTIYTIKDNGEIEEETVEYENGTGYFAVDGEGKLYWTGSSEESCCDCIFEKNM